MADTKISALPASATPLAGTEVLPIVQSGATKQVSVANLTAGRAISATELTLTAGNLIVASGQGVDFSATPGTGTSELLDDYEEGTWTPILNGFTTTGTITTSGSYIKVGGQVTVAGVAAASAGGTISATAIASTISGLPFVGTASAGFASSFWNGANITSYGIGQVYTTVIYSPTLGPTGANESVGFVATYFV